MLHIPWFLSDCRPDWPAVHPGPQAAAPPDPAQEPHPDHRRLPPITSLPHPPAGGAGQAQGGSGREGNGHQSHSVIQCMISSLVLVIGVNV